MLRICLEQSASTPFNGLFRQSAALLHDVSKGTPDHALAGAGLMSQLGYPVLAPLCDAKLVIKE